MLKTLLIVAHAPSPNTVRLRDAVADGVRDADTHALTLRILSPFDAGPDDVRTADGLILGTMENLGYMSGALKDFFDRTYYSVLEEKQGLPLGVYVRAGMDGTGTLRAIDSIACAGLRWRLIQEPILCKGAWNDQFIEPCYELGQGMAAGLDAGIF